MGPKDDCSDPAPARGMPLLRAAGRQALMEFHIRREVREKYGLGHALFSLRGNVVFADLRQVRDLTERINAGADPRRPETFIRTGQFFAMGLIDEILHYVVALYREQVQSDVFDTALLRLEANLGEHRTALLLRAFGEQFPPRQVYAGNVTVDQYLAGNDGGENNRSLSLEEMLLLALANLNPAFSPFTFLFDDQDLEDNTVYSQAIEEIKIHLASLPVFGPDGLNLWDLLRAPALASPHSLMGQLDYMRRHWGLIIGKFMGRLLMTMDVIKEEEKPAFFGPGPMEVLTYGGLDEYERFSPDQDWMPRTVLMAKSTLVWLYQLSQRYGRPIERLDQIPDEELDELARRGFTGLWLIGLWERSNASKTIKQWTGNPEAAASAYSLCDYDIAGELGGWDSLSKLRDRCARRGIRLGSDMVPNHTGIDSRWIMEYPDRFLQLPYSPFPGYTFNSGNLSNREGIGIYIEDHYYSRSDAAVVFKRVNFDTGEVRYIYHGNDGTSMPWNDTAQIDFLNPEAREAVIRTIVGVCRQFSIVRFDAAMTLAKRHIQRLWYPEPGHGGDIASRAEHAIPADEFNRRIPNEFWRDVVDRCAVEAPNTLLLAEAFWMMEGYFVRTLGMHRVYNSAFMNMLKHEENAKYRETIKNTLEFDPEILKRFVNFMNNPDEETAVAQFGKGDKYFGICTLLVTMPGLPMFGHGQIEGFEEKYGMEYRRSYQDETPDLSLVERHEREIFPLMKRRAVFSGSADFCLYDLYGSGGQVNENVFAYSNRAWGDKALVFYNNAYAQAAGWIHRGAAAIPRKDGSSHRDDLCYALALHGEEGYFTCLREQRSNRWFIRSSKEIADRGFFVSLNGYEAQVFMDIREVQDSRGRWARLCAELKGRGVWDLDVAMQDFLLGELYVPFMALFEPKLIEGLYRLSGAGAKDGGSAEIAGDAGPVQSFLASLRGPALTFINTAFRCLGGMGDLWDPFVPERAYPRLEPETVWQELAAYVGRLGELGQPGDTASPAIPLWRNLKKQISDRPHTALYAFGYGIFAMFRSIVGGGTEGAAAKALIDHWHLDRKFREACEAQGVSGDEAYRVTEIMKALLARTVPASAALYGPAPSALYLIQENYAAEDFRAILGVNLFDDVVWFNKEAFERTLLYAPLFSILESGAAFRESSDSAEFTGSAGVHETDRSARAARQKRVRIIAELTEQFLRAEAGSGYRLDRLIEVLATGGKGPAGKSGNRGKPVKESGR
jgi:glycosidase